MENSTASPTTPRPKPERSEEAFLADQAAAAQGALSNTLERMRADLGASADLAAWARKYPWPAVGAAAAVGFLAAVVVGSPPRRTADPVAPKTEADAPGGYSPSVGQNRGLFHSLLGELVRNLATALQGALVGRDRLPLFASRRLARADRSGRWKRSGRRFDWRRFWRRFTLGQRRRAAP